MLQLTSMIPWFVGLCSTFVGILSQILNKIQQFLYILKNFGALGVLGVSSFHGICWGWQGIRISVQVPTRCPWKDIDRCSAWNHAISVQRTDRDSKSAQGWEWNLVVVSSMFHLHSYLGRWSHFIRYFSDGKTSPEKWLIFPGLYAICMRIVVYVIRKETVQDVCSLWEPYWKLPQPQNSHNVWELVDSLFDFKESSNDIWLLVQYLQMKVLNT